MSLKDKYDWIDALSNPRRAATTPDDIRDRLRARGFFPQGFFPFRLTPVMVESACSALQNPDAIRALAWRLLNTTGTLDLSGEGILDAWSAWAIEHRMTNDSQQVFRTRLEKTQQAVDSLSEGGRLEGDRHWSAAADTYRRAIELDPQCPIAWLGLGIVQHYSVRLTEAEKAFREVIRLVPGHIVACLRLAKLLVGQDRRDEAIAILCQGLELNLDTETLAQWLELVQHQKAVLAIQLQFPARTRYMAGDEQPVRELLASLLQGFDSKITNKIISSKLLVETLIAPLLPHKDRARDMLQLLRELGYDRHTRPLLLAFEAAIEGQHDMVEELEPEIREVTRRLLVRLTGQGAAHT